METESTTSPPRPAPTSPPASQRLASIKRSLKDEADRLAVEIAHLDELRALRQQLLAALLALEPPEVKAQPNPKPRPTPKKRTSPGRKHYAPSPAVQERLLMVMREAGEPVSLRGLTEALAEEMSSDPVRRGINTLRDQGRIRLVMGRYGTRPALYAPMPEELSTDA
jgi:hypothetical protein